MPADTGAAFVVVQHLSPDFKSMMGELLARHTEMPVLTAEDGQEVEPNRVFLLPPKMEITLADGRLRLTGKDPRQGLSFPIDHFLESLAKDRGEQAVAI